MADELTDPVRYLDWDSDFFNVRIGRIKSNNMTEQDVSSVDAWAARNNMDCLYYLADGNLIESSRAAESHGFFLTDLRITFQIKLEKALPKFPEVQGFRKAGQMDMSVIEQMAGEYHTISRFFADDHFEREKCRELYRLWIRRDFEEVDHFLWIIERNGEVAGYTSASVDRDESLGEIGLVGVNSKWRGQGIGLQLQKTVLNELQSMGMRRVEVVTQGRNTNAQNLYIKSGYALKSIDLWYHKWYEKS